MYLPKKPSHSCNGLGGRADEGDTVSRVDLGGRGVINEVEGLAVKRFPFIIVMLPSRTVKSS